MLIYGLSSRKITKVAAHPEGQHYLALSSSGEVFSWGCGDGGRLGHGDTTYGPARFSHGHSCFSVFKNVTRHSCNHLV